MDTGRVDEDEQLMPFQMHHEFSNFTFPPAEESNTTQLFNSIFAGSLYDYSLPPLPDTKYVMLPSSVRCVVCRCRFV